MIDMKYTEIIKMNRLLEDHSKKKYKITLLSNIMIHQLKDICEYSLRKEGINAFVELGDYDNIVQNSLTINSDSNAVIIFWEVSNLVNNLQYTIDLLNDEEFYSLENKIKYEIDIVLESLTNIPLVLINTFSSKIFTHDSLMNNKLDRLVFTLNNYFLNKKHTNIHIIDIDKVLTSVCIDNAFNIRNYLSSKTLYTISFYKSYLEFIKPLFLFYNGKTKKALILDCDNTLWKGILGEDGYTNIQMFEEIQYRVKALAKSGVIIGLCSKNNPKDVDNVLLNHPNMILKEEDIVIKAINWENKVANLKHIAEELNIGLDSLVFLDDSDFEINLIKTELPMITVYQVPKQKHEYISMFDGLTKNFFKPKITKEDVNKTQIYKSDILRKHEKKKLGNIEDYLKQLELSITVYLNKTDQISRISQMTQKTNQFNLTTYRYTEQDIKSFLKNENNDVVTIQVKDKFGDNGIVGLCILTYNDDSAYIDTLLMSCRVIGRNIEYKFLDILIELIKKRKINTLNALYKKTLKNSQVSDLYDTIGFQKKSQTTSQSEYTLDLNNYKAHTIEYIKVTNV